MPSPRGEENRRSLKTDEQLLDHRLSDLPVSCSEASLALGRDARPYQGRFVFAGDGVDAGERSSHAGAWILEVVIPRASAARSLKGLSQPR